MASKYCAYSLKYKKKREILQGLQGIIESQISLVPGFSLETKSEENGLEVVGTDCREACVIMIKNYCRDHMVSCEILL